MTKRHRVVLGSTIALVSTALLVYVLSRSTVVRFGPAKEVASAYLEALIEKDLSSALSYYSSDFTTEEYRQTTWANALGVKLDNWGPITDYSLVSEKFSPVSLDDESKRPVVVFTLEYSVTHAHRRALETLTICPDPVDGQLRIVGHQILIEGQQEPLSAGWSIETVREVRFP